MKSVNIILETPRHGWLPFTVKVGEYSISNEASDLGLNVIDQFVAMLDRLETKQTAECYFYLEPSAYVLRLDPGVDDLSLIVEFVEDFDTSDEAKRVILYQAPIDSREFKTVIIEALKAFRHYEFANDDWPLPENWERLEKL